jgi:hypothetical protein
MSADRRSVSRRSFIRGVGGVVGTSAGVGLVSRETSASDAKNTPDHVSDPEYDESLLEEHKPRLLTYDLNVAPSSIHGFVVRSELDESTALTYWVEYPVQLDASGFASHIGDHEPFYVFLENEGTTDEYVDRVVYSGYHWLAAESSSPPTDTGEDDGRPRAYVFPQYHHYSVGQARNDPRQGDDLPLKDLTSSLFQWLNDDNFHDALASDWNGRGSPAFNPWIMLDKASWWSVDGLSNFEQGLRSAWLFLGIRGAEGADI